MSFPLITIVPSFFIAMLASPVLMTTDSPASITRFDSHLQAVVLSNLDLASAFDTALFVFTDQRHEIGANGDVLTLARL